MNTKVLIPGLAVTWMLMMVILLMLIFKLFVIVINNLFSQKCKCYNIKIQRTM